MIVFYIVLGIAVILIIWIIAIYNGLVTLKNRTEEAWSDIDVQLKRRYDLIPNLVETVKGYATHEQGTLMKVTEARTAAMNAHNSNAPLEEQAKNENALSSTLKSIFALAESYPDLKANQNFAKLQDELSDTENKIQASRRFYNGNVRDLNTQIETFPSNIIAGMFKFVKRAFFELTDEKEKEAVKVSF
ncbi:MAG: LemA family protein [bacterium]|nr:LemA family protein [bacterium]